MIYYKSRKRELDKTHQYTSFIFKNCNPVLLSLFLQYYLRKLENINVEEGLSIFTHSYNTVFLDVLEVEGYNLKIGFYSYSFYLSMIEKLNDLLVDNLKIPFTMLYIFRLKNVEIIKPKNGLVKELGCYVDKKKYIDQGHNISLDGISLFSKLRTEVENPNTRKYTFRRNKEASMKTKSFNEEVDVVWNQIK